MSQSPCSVCDKPLLRLRYFPGQLMTADDMRAEQEFLLKKARRHNRFLHGWASPAVSMCGCRRRFRVLPKDRSRPASCGYARATP